MTNPQVADEYAGSRKNGIVRTAVEGLAAWWPGSSGASGLSAARRKRNVTYFLASPRIGTKNVAVNTNLLQAGPGTTQELTCCLLPPLIRRCSG
jgi:hypothetical protein